MEFIAIALLIAELVGGWWLMTKSFNGRSSIGGRSYFVKKRLDFCCYRSYTNIVATKVR